MRPRNSAGRGEPFYIDLSAELLRALLSVFRSLSAAPSSPHAKPQQQAIKEMVALCAAQGSPASFRLSIASPCRRTRFAGRSRPPA